MCVCLSVTPNAILSLSLSLVLTLGWFVEPCYLALPASLSSTDTYRLYRQTDWQAPGQVGWCQLGLCSRVEERASGTHCLHITCVHHWESIHDPMSKRFSISPSSPLYHAHAASLGYQAKSWMIPPARPMFGIGYRRLIELSYYTFTHADRHTSLDLSQDIIGSGGCHDDWCAYSLSFIWLCRWVVAVSSCSPSSLLYLRRTDSNLNSYCYICLALSNECVYIFSVGARQHALPLHLISAYVPSPIPFFPN